MITEYKGLVRGIVVRSTSLGKGISEGLTIVLEGKTDAAYTALAEKSRRQAYDRMVEQASALAANGIIGIRYDSCEISEFRMEIVCYGTAVSIEKR